MGRTLKTDIGQASLPDLMSTEDASQLWEHLTRRSRTGRPHRRGPMFVVIAATVLLVPLGTALALHRGGGSSSATPNTHGAQPRIPPSEVPSAPHRGVFDGIPMSAVGTNPFGPGGKSVSLEAAQSQVAFTIVQPDSAAASPSLLSIVWLGPAGNVEGPLSAGGKAVVLDYEASDIRIIESPAPPNLGSDAQAEQAFAQDAATLHAPSGAVQTIAGGPALVLPSQGQGTTIDMYLHGVTIMVLGSPTITTSSLVATAQTLS